MGILGWIVLGLVAGLIAKAIMPGRDGGGIILTTILGVIGAILGGFLGQLLFHTELGTFFELRTWLLAIGGSVVILLIHRAVSGRRARA